MDKSEAAGVITVLDPLLRALEMLTFVSRQLHPPHFAQLMASIGAPDDDLRSARAKPFVWPEHLSGIRSAMDTAGDAALSAYAGLREALDGEGDVRSVYRALRFLSKGLEALYPLAGILAPVNRFFLNPDRRSDTALEELLLRAPARENTGVIHFGAESGERGGFSLYVPEHYVPDHAWPLVMALHGGSGNGRQFLWSWLRDARSEGAILVSPTSIQGTWALTGHDVDTPNLMQILDFVRSNWSIDPNRLLLTGMSDGGTFTYVSGLEAGSPFTHLAPVSSAFHPLLAEMVDRDRLRGLPIYIIHGALDWMFPIDMARHAQLALSAAGAAVTYREIDDLSHTYPRELNKPLLDWLATTPSKDRTAAA